MFFKEIQVIGEENLPKEGPVIVSGTHNGQFVDAGMMIIALQRKVNLVIAMKSTKLKLLGVFLRFLNLIPTERPIDKKKKGMGFIVKIDGRQVKGLKTSFKKQVKPKDLIKLISSGEELVVESVESNTEITLKKPYSSVIDDSKELYDVLPKINQEQVFKNVFRNLLKNRCLGIFPEGGSHDQPRVMPLKAGACVFVWGSYMQYQKKVPMVEIGINYFGCHRFRSKVVVNIGKPRYYDFDIERKDDADYKRATIDKMMVDLKTSLEAVRIVAPSYNELLGLYCAHKIYIPTNVELGSEKDFKLFKKFSSAYLKIKDDPEVKQFAVEIDSFRKKIKSLGLKVEEIKNLELTFSIGMIQYIKRTIFFFVLVS